MAEERDGAREQKLYDDKEDDRVDSGGDVDAKEGRFPPRREPHGLHDHEAKDDAGEANVTVKHERRETHSVHDPNRDGQREEPRAKQKDANRPCQVERPACLLHPRPNGVEGSHVEPQVEQVEVEHPMRHNPEHYYA